jgi:hypothetical protein
MEVGQSTPDLARETIEAFDGLELPPEAREVLTRLANHDDMRTVWKRLPREQSGKVITLALATYLAASDLPFLSATRREFVTSATELAACARRIADDLAKPTIFVQRLSNTALPITLSEYVELLRETARFYGDLDKDVHQFLRSMRLPRPSRKRIVPNAKQIYFARTMARLLVRLFRRPHDAVNAALTTVVFNLQQPIGEETVRSWRREDARTG